MYALLTFLPALYERRRVIIMAAAGAIVLGVGLEYAQLLTGWRDFEVADMIADTVGVFLGLGSGMAVRSMRRSRQGRSVVGAGITGQNKTAGAVPREAAGLPGGPA